ncbi:pyridoxamine 5'-phosphate oxidase family protein [Aeromicrobium sp. YIM 150415]|uniref:pyridoxamine 5'-phosphate oxidase family protein n=1 Tax=Aeromicrobium sp. YIM 150415 TaxID=2803912 RepID=UPI00196567ED|nr:pyridoxamine 5'-phosphate oxidase family protein [Aeromicrobium sp. YIM 150415]MBM9462366.1 pyridoxamine 5'-phosphate oxidase family protein [Aeromicrobium sp. YIM 150415]
MNEGHIRPLTPEECREYLALTRIGRLAFAGPDRLELLVLNAVSDGSTVLLRTESETVLATMTTAGPVPVAFETDHLDELLQSGWSVTVHGTASIASDVQRDALRGVLPHAWAPGDRDLIIAIDVETLGGRKVRARSGP